MKREVISLDVVILFLRIRAVDMGPMLERYKVSITMHRIALLEFPFGSDERFGRYNINCPTMS